LGEGSCCQYFTTTPGSEGKSIEKRLTALAASLRVKTKYGSGRGIPPLRMISYAVPADKLPTVRGYK